MDICSLVCACSNIIFCVDALLAICCDFITCFCNIIFDFIICRSLGDSIVHKSGVSAEPETLEHMLDDSDEFIVIATDGIWDVMDNQQV